jgi:hypothetical protein
MVAYLPVGFSLSLSQLDKRTDTSLLALCYHRLISTKTEFANEDVLSLVKLLWDVVLQTSDDIEVQVRWGVHGCHDGVAAAI